jgi:hypothetical protein
MTQASVSSTDQGGGKRRSGKLNGQPRKEATKRALKEMRDNPRKDWRAG